MMHLKTLCKLYSDNSKCLAEFKATGKQSKMHVKCLHVLCMYYTMFFIYAIGFKVIIIIYSHADKSNYAAKNRSKTKIASKPRSPANTRSKTKPASQPQSAKILSTNGAKRKKNCANKPQGKSAVQVAIVGGN